jgi:hypothetical protein
MPLPVITREVAVHVHAEMLVAFTFGLVFTKFVLSAHAGGPASAAVPASGTVPASDGVPPSVGAKPASPDTVPPSTPVGTPPQAVNTRLRRTTIDGRMEVTWCGGRRKDARRA